MTEEHRPVQSVGGEFVVAGESLVELGDVERLDALHELVDAVAHEDDVVPADLAHGGLDALEHPSGVRDPMDAGDGEHHVVLQRGDGRAHQLRVRRSGT